jgi:predicted AAA+ superfamily ATPase
MASPVRLTREKISTTISSATLAYLEQLIEKGEARTLADAIDSVVQKLLVYENRERLANDTAAYFDNLSPEALEEEDQLAAALANSVKGIDFDREP